MSATGIPEMIIDLMITVWIKWPCRLKSDIRETMLIGNHVEPGIQADCDGELHFGQLSEGKVQVGKTSQDTFNSP